MKDSTIVKICIAVIAVTLVVTTAFFLMMPSNTQEKTEFGLTSTKAVISPGDERSLSIWILPDGAEYSMITWRSADETVATITNGTIKGVSAGESVVTASLDYNGKHYSDTCRVNVSDETDSRVYRYDAYSEKMDYAVISGQGFEDGLLSLTFNADNNIVVSLSGYDSSWLDTTTTNIGCAKTDFKSISMDISKNGNSVANAVYTKGLNKYSTTDVSNEKAYTSLIAVHGLTYGEYDVTFTLNYGTGSYNVEGTFQYCEGDGLRDIHGNYNVQYSWRADDLHYGTTNRSFMISYPYEEYFAQYLRNSQSLTIYSNAAVNDNESSHCVNYISQNRSVELLSDALKADYTAAYGLTSYDNQDFAQYLLTFAQVCFDYEFDNTQYYKLDSKYQDCTDYWAYTCETLFSGKGDCEDTSIVLASIYKKLGFDTGLVVLPNHMTCAVSLENFDNHSSIGISNTIFKATYDTEDYYFCETTSYCPIIKYNTTRTSATYLVSIMPPEFLNVYSYYLLGMINSEYYGKMFTFYPA